MAHRALLLVDLQNDFCAGGALAVPEGDSTVDVANALIDWRLARGEPIVARSSTAIALSLTTVTGRKPNWTAGCVVRRSWS